MTYISDINTGTPSGQDLVLNGDNEIRALKTDVVNTLGGLDGPVYEDATTSGTGGSTPVTAATMSSWESRINALEGVASSPEGTSVPVGGIMIWHGPGNTIPAGWKVCDGTTYQYTDSNQQVQSITTPDLRGRFPMGPDWDTTVQGDTGGLRYTDNEQNRLNDAAGGHTHSATSGAHALTTSEMPLHGHSMFSGNTTNGDSPPPNFTETVAYFGDNVGNNRSYKIQKGNNSSAVGATYPAGSGAAHTHPGGTTSQAGAHQHSFNATQPFVALYFICYVAA